MRCGPNWEGFTLRFDQREISRLKAVKKLREMHSEISKYSDDYSGAIWNSALYPVLFDVGSVVVEAIVTGGGSVAVQGATKLAAEVKGSTAFQKAVAEISKTAGSLRRKTLPASKNILNKSKSLRKSVYSPDSGELKDAGKKVVEELVTNTAFTNSDNYKPMKSSLIWRLAPINPWRRKSFIHPSPRTPSKRRLPMHLRH